jgi:hypothetical protein
LRRRFFGNPGAAYALNPRTRSHVPIYYFNVRGDGLDVPDMAGRHCADSATAWREAERMAMDLVDTALSSGALPPDSVIEVDDEEQRPVLALPLRQGKRQI